MIIKIIYISKRIRILNNYIAMSGTNKTAYGCCINWTSSKAILDGNITTIIAAIVLMIFGTGAVKGFAITLLIGIVLSLITGLLVTKGLMNVVYKINSTKASHYALKKPTNIEKKVVAENE